MRQYIVRVTSLIFIPHTCDRYRKTQFDDYNLNLDRENRTNFAFFVYIKELNWQCVFSVKELNWQCIKKNRISDRNKKLSKELKWQYVLFNI